MEKETFDTLIIENARILFKNFSGVAQRYNNAGNRNFCVVIDNDLAGKLAADNWKIGYLKPQEEGDEPTPIINVTVSYEKKAPEIVVIRGRRGTKYDETMVHEMDSIDTRKCDIRIKGSHYISKITGEPKVGVYLESMFVTLEEDTLDKKYSFLYEDEEELPFNVNE